MKLEHNDYDDEPEFDVADDLYHEKEKKDSENDDNDYVFDEVKGAHGKKTVLSKLNQRIVGKHEMDEIFCDWNWIILNQNFLKFKLFSINQTN